MRVALVHDWLTGMRGGERVLEEFCELFPDASLFTLFHRQGSVSPRIESMPIQTSFLNRIPWARNHYPYLLPLYPLAIAKLNLSGFDLILSISHAAAKGITKPPGSLHICYCLTPMRYLWDMKDDYFQNAGGLGLKRAALGALSSSLRRWDRATAQKVDYFIADSRLVQDRISGYYKRTADVIYPPVNTDFFTPPSDGSSRDFYLIVSALVSYKRVDVAINAFSGLESRLIIVGSGPDRAKLQSKATKNVEVRGFVSNEELRNLYRNARAVIITAREDFGLVSLEAQACGCPVLAYGAGGSLESIEDGQTGVFYSERTGKGLIEGLKRLETTRFDRARLRRNAEQFSRENFRRNLKATVQAKLEEAGRRFAQAHPLGSDKPVPLHPSLNGISGSIKRSIDLLLSSAGLVITAVPLLLIAFLIRLTSKGPALYIQTRLGLNGKRFTIYKIRTMYLDAERDGPTWAVDNDQRCTPLGGFLRRFGIDEWPQFWNVIRGDMSLVGPRPERPEFHKVFKAKYPGYEQRLTVRAGLTGLAQVRGWRGNTSIAGRIKSDIEYVKNWSLIKDLEILLLTPVALLCGRKQRMSRQQIEANGPTAPSI